MDDALGRAETSIKEITGELDSRTFVYGHGSKPWVVDTERQSKLYVKKAFKNILNFCFIYTLFLLSKC